MRGIIVCSVLLAGACVTGEPPLERMIFVAELREGPGMPEGISGLAQMVSNADHTIMTVSVEGAEPGDSLGWHIRSGACNGEGDRVGPEVAFPGFQVDDLGNGSRISRLNRRVSAGTYSAEVFVTGSESSVIACGNFERSDVSDL